MRTLLSSTVVTLAGTPGDDGFLALLNPAGTAVDFYVNANPNSGGTPVHTVAVGDLAGLTVNGGGGGSDTLVVITPGLTVPVDASAAPGLALYADGGTVRLAAAAALAGVTVGPAGALDAAGQSLAAATLTVDGRLTVGAGGSVAQAGGTVSAGTLDVGTAPGTAAAYALAGGDLSAGYEAVGTATAAGGASGSVDQTGGTNTVGASGLWVGSGTGGAGTYALAGGSLADIGLLVVGAMGSTAGAFAQTGGAATVAFPALVGFAGTGGVAVSGGTLHVGSFYLGYSVGVGTLALSGSGALDVDDGLVVASADYGPAGHPTSSAAVTLADDATLATAQTYLGYTGPATFTQTGGTHTTGYLILDGPHARTTTYHVSAGTVNAAATLDAYMPAADGPTLVNEGWSYPLALFGTASTTHWGVNWGDGTTDAIAAAPSSTSHVYTAGGQTYTVQPTAYDAGGNATPAPAVSVLVNDVPAAVTVAAVPAEPVGQPTAVSATFTDPGTAETHTALIDWGDGTTSAATVTEADGSGTITASHAYALHGSYTATLIVTDSGGAVATAAAAVTVDYVAPAVSVAAPSDPAEPGTAVTVTLHDGGPEAASTITAWSLDWGDGTTDAVTTPPDADGDWTPSHAYAAAGTYTVHATATDGAGVHDAGTATVTVGPPAGPTGLTVTATDGTHVLLAWTPNPADPNTTFEVQRQGDDGTWATLATVDGTAAAGDTYADDTAAAGAAYAYRVRSAGATADSDYSDPASVATPLATPTVQATAVGGGEVDLSWSGDADAAGVQYEVDRQAADGGDWETLTVTSDTSYADTDVLGQATYGYRVQAFTDAATSDYGTASATTDLAVPAAPADLAATATSPSAVDLTWAAGTDPGGAAAGYAVGVSDDQGRTYAPFGGPLPATATGVTVTGLAADTVYLFQVTATNAAGSSDPAGPVGARTPTPAPGQTTVLSLDARGETAALLTWSYSASDDAGFEVEQADVSAGENYAALTQPGPTDATGGVGTYTATGLVPGHTYGFQVRADRVDGTVSAYASATVTMPSDDPPPPPTTTPPLQPPGLTGVTVTPPASGGGYDVGVTVGTPYPIQSGSAGSSGSVGSPGGGYELIPYLRRTDDGSDLLGPGLLPPFTVDQPADGSGTDAAGLDGVPLTPGTTYTIQVALSDGSGQASGGSGSGSGSGSGGGGGTVTTLPKKLVVFQYWGMAVPAGETPASGWSAPVTFTTPGVAPAAPQVTADPPAADGSVTVHWSWPGTATAGPGDVIVFGSVTPTGSQLVGDAGNGYPVAAGQATISIPPAAVSSLVGIVVSPTEGITAPSAPVRIINDTVPASPAATTGLVATYVARAGGVDLHWLDPSHAEGGFEVQRSVDGQSFTTIGTTGADDNEYLDTTAGPDSAYFYRVRPAGGAWSNVARADTPGIAIKVQAPFDPALNPELFADPAASATVDLQPSVPDPTDSYLVPVTVQVPVGADTVGTVDLTYSPSICLFEQSTPGGDLTLIGESDGSMSLFSWDVGGDDGDPATRTFYAQANPADPAGAGFGSDAFKARASLTLDQGSIPSSNAPTTYPATTRPVTVSTLAITLGDGSPGKVLQASDGGTQHLVSLHLAVPVGLAAGTQVTLSTEASGEVDVWDSSSPSARATPLIGRAAGSYTWTAGGGGVPATLWVGATQASTDLGDIVFTLTFGTSADGEGGESADPATQPKATTKPASAIAIALETENAPNTGAGNGHVGDDWTGKVEQWLVGQEVDMKVVLKGPASLIVNPNYQWVVPGTTALDWETQDYQLGDGSAANGAASNYLAEDSLSPDGVESGTGQQEVRFYWVVTPNGTEHAYRVPVYVSLGGVRYTTDVTFDVHVPTVNASAPTFGTFISDPTSLTFSKVTVAGFSGPGAIATVATVTQPAGFSAGSWVFAQIVTPGDISYHYNNNGSVDAYAWSLNGKAVLDGASMPDPGQLAMHATTPGAPVVTTVVSTGSASYMWVDNAYTVLTKGGTDAEPAGIGEAIHEIVRNDSYQLYVMYLPPGPASGTSGVASNWVPVLVASWHMKFDIKDPTKAASSATQWVGQGTPTQPTGTPWTTPTRNIGWPQSNSHGEYVRV